MRIPGVWLSSILLAMALAISTGCGGDDDDDDNNPMDPDDTSGHPPAEMVGSWGFQSVLVNGNPTPLSDALEWHDGVVAARFHIQTNSAYVYEEVDTRGGQIWYEHGFVYVDGNEIDVNILGDGDGPVEETSFLTFTLQGDVFTLQESEDGTTTVFTLSRR